MPSPSRSNLVIALLWAFVLVTSVLGSTNAPLIPSPNGFSHVMTATLVLMPILFFGAMSFWAPHSPFYHPTLARFVDGRFGEGTLASFLARLRPLLLFAVASTLQGVIYLVHAIHTDSPAGVYVVSGFFLSGGTGFALAHGILYSRKVVGVYPAAKTADSQLAPVSSKPERKPLREALRIYWTALIGIALFPTAAFVGGDFLQIPFEYFILPFFVVCFLAGWPYLSGKAPYSFWLAAMLVYMLGGFLAVLLSQVIRAALA